MIQSLQPLQNLKSHRTHLCRREYAVQTCQTVRTIRVRKAPALLWFAVLKPASAVHVKEPAGGRQFQSVLTPNQAILQKFLSGHTEIGRDDVDFLFREDRAIPPAAVPALAAIVSGKQLPMERQKLLIQLVYIGFRMKCPGQ